MAKEEGQGEVTARVMLEMLGAPKEHIETTLRDYVENLKQDDTLKILKEDIAPAEQQKKLFSIFAELEIRFKDVQRLLDFCFDSMPSSVDIIKPDDFRIESKQLTDFLNDIQARLHDNDMIIKTTNARNKILEKNTKGIISNFVYYMINEEPRDAESMAKKMGLPEKFLKPFLDELVKAGKISEKEGKYEGINRGAEEKG